MRMAFLENTRETPFFYNKLFGQLGNVKTFNVPKMARKLEIGNVKTQLKAYSCSSCPNIPRLLLSQANNYVEPVSNPTDSSFA